MKLTWKEHAQWIYWWFLCLFNNKDYRAYCKAIRINDSKTIAVYESKHPRIKQIHNDWGDLEELLLNDFKTGGFNAWYKKNIHLFLRRTITEIHCEADINDTNLNLAISLSNNKTKTIKQVTAYINKQYKEKRQLNNQKPLYKLYAPKNRLTKSTFNAVAKATDAHMLSNPLNPKKKAMTAVQQVVYIMDKHEEIANSKTPTKVKSLVHTSLWQFKWSKRLKADYESGMDDNKMLFESQIRTIRKYKSTYNTMLEGVLKCKFPNLPK